MKVINFYYYLTEMLIKSVHTEVVCFSQTLLKQNFSEKIFQTQGKYKNHMKIIILYIKLT